MAIHTTPFPHNATSPNLFIAGFGRDTTRKAKPLAKKPSTAFVFTVGCAITLALAIIVVGLAVSFVPNIRQWFFQQLAIEAQRQALVDNWQAPADDVSPGAFFPKKVANYQLSLHDTKADIPSIRFDIPGWHACYDSADSQIEVFAYKVTDLEREALFGRIEKLDDEEDAPSQMLVMTSFRCYLKTSTHQQHLWWMKDWLFVFQTTDSQDREPFVRAFLSTTSKQNQSQAAEENP